jgi:hypothetical protein
LPILAITANYFNRTDNTINFWFWFGATIAIIIYLGVAGELITFPKNFFLAVIGIFAVPIQIFLALIFSQGNIWSIFLSSFVVECLGLLLGVAGYALFVFKKQNRGDWKKIASILTLLSLAFYGFVGIFWQSATTIYQSNGWPTLFIFSALISAAINYSRKIYQRNQGMNIDGHEIADPSKMILWGLLIISIGLIILEIIREKF